MGILGKKIFLKGYFLFHLIMVVISLSIILPIGISLYFNAHNADVVVKAHNVENIYHELLDLVDEQGVEVKDIYSINIKDSEVYITYSDVEENIGVQLSFKITDNIINFLLSPTSVDIKDTSIDIFNIVDKNILINTDIFISTYPDDFSYLLVYPSTVEGNYSYSGIYKIEDKYISLTNYEYDTGSDTLRSGVSNPNLNLDIYNELLEYIVNK